MRDFSEKELGEMEIGTLLPVFDSEGRVHGLKERVKDGWVYRYFCDNCKFWRKLERLR